MRAPWLKWLMVSVATALALLVGAMSANAASVTYTVASGTDSSTVTACPSDDVCPTLRDAVYTADEPANSGSTIQLSATTYALTAGALAITESTDVTGDGPGMTSIAQSETGDGVLTVSGGGAVAISGVTITGGNVVGTHGTSGDTDGGDVDGGGIDNSGILTLTDDAITGDTARGGAPSTAGNGTYGASDGGGIYSDGTLTLIDSTLSGDEALGGVSGDNVFAGYGGAIFASGALTIRNSTLGPDDTAAGDGGAIDADGGPVTIVNSTITDDTAGTAALGGFGGGLFLSQMGTLANDTVADNSATGTGGGGNLATNSANTITLEDTIIAGGEPVGADNNCYEASSKSFADGGHNLEDDTASQCDLTGTSKSDLLVSSADLASGLEANGGPTDTLALLSGAPEIATGGACTNPVYADTPELVADQRGLPRPAAGPCDIGAFQTQDPANTTAPTVSPAAASVGGCPVVRRSL